MSKEVFLKKVKTKIGRSFGDLIRQEASALNQIKGALHDLEEIEDNAHHFRNDKLKKRIQEIIKQTTEKDCGELVRIKK